MYTPQCVYAQYHPACYGEQHIKGYCKAENYNEQYDIFRTNAFMELTQMRCTNLTQLVKLLVKTINSELDNFHKNIVYSRVDCNSVLLFRIMF